MQNIIECFPNKMNESCYLFQIYGFEIQGFKIF